MKTEIKIKLLFAGQIATACLFLLGWTYTLKTNTPAGTDDPTEADDRMREIKGAFIERLDTCMYFTPSATSTYDATDTGKFRYINIRDANDVSSVDDDEFIIQTKEVNGIKELHLMDEDENEVQLTSAGTINITSSDLVGTLANDTYFTAVNNAGDGTVNLIKANTSDVAVIPDGSEMATSAAPTEDADIVNKAYADTKEDIISTQTTAELLGSWTNKDTDNQNLTTGHSYKGQSDGFVLVTSSDIDQRPYYTVYTDSSNPPTTNRSRVRDPDGGTVHSVMIPVKKDDYWKIVDTSTFGNITIYWIGFGTGGCVDQN